VADPYRTDSKQCSRESVLRPTRAAAAFWLLPYKQVIDPAEAITGGAACLPSRPASRLPSSSRGFALLQLATPVECSLSYLTWLIAFAWDQTLNTSINMDGFNLTTIDACWSRCRKTKLTQKTAAVRTSVTLVSSLPRFQAAS